MTFRLSEVSRANLAGVRPDLVSVVEKAIEITDTDFRVICGVRTLAEQKKMVASGASRTMNSRHLVQDDGFSHAVDVVALDGGKVSWDWPHYPKIAKAMKAAGTALGVPVEWGGDWPKFRDGPHFQLPKDYKMKGPANANG